jgi:hypothetical protein
MRKINTTKNTKQKTKKNKKTKNKKFKGGSLRNLRNAVLSRMPEWRMPILRRPEWRMPEWRMPILRRPVSRRPHEPVDADAYPVEQEYPVQQATVVDLSVLEREIENIKSKLKHIPDINVYDDLLDLHRTALFIKNNHNYQSDDNVLYTEFESKFSKLLSNFEQKTTGGSGTALSVETIDTSTTENFKSLYLLKVLLSLKYYLESCNDDFSNLEHNNFAIQRFIQKSNMCIILLRYEYALEGEYEKSVLDFIDLYEY